VTAEPTLTDLLAETSTPAAPPAALVDGTVTLRIPAPVNLVKRKDPKTKRVKYAPAAAWLTMNDRLYWRVRAQLVKDWRTFTTNAALAAGLRAGQFERARIDALLQFNSTVRRDPPNWHPTVKAAVDALTKGSRTHPGLGLIPDDNPKYLHCHECPHLRISDERLPKSPYGPYGLLWLTITDLSAEEPASA
jgi:hypothetical protein